MERIRRAPEAEHPEDELGNLEKDVNHLSPDEKKTENVRRLTEEAMDFVAERKAIRNAENSKRNIGLAENEEVPMNEQEGRIILPAETKKKPGFIDSLKTKLKIRQLRKEGFENPERAMEIMEYVKNNIGLREEREFSTAEQFEREMSWSNKKLVSKPEELANGNIGAVFEYDINSRYFKSALKKMSESPNDVLEVMETMSDMGYKLRIPDIEGDDFAAMIGDNDIMRKLSVIESLGIEKEQLNPYYTMKLLGDKEVFDSLVPETIERLKSISERAGGRMRFDFVKDALPLAKNDSIYELFQLCGDDEVPHSGYGLEGFYNDLKAVEASGFMEEIRQANSLGLDVSGILAMKMRSVSGKEWNKKETDKFEENLDKADISKSSQDPEFVKFMENMRAVIPEGKISLNDFLELKKFQSDPDFWAFFESARNLGMLKADDDGNFSIRKIEDAMEEWENAIRTPYTDIKKQYQGTLFNPDFQKFAKGIEGNGIDLDFAAHIFLNRPEIMSGMESEDGKRLFGYLSEKGIGVQANIELFISPEIVNDIESIGDMFEIGNNTILGDLMKLHRKGKLEGIADFIRGTNFSLGRKFYPNDVYLLERFCDRKDSLDMEIFAKYTSFYLTKKVVDIMDADTENVSKLFALGREGLIGKFDSGFLLGNFEQILAIPENKREIFVELFSRIDASPSQEIQRVKGELMSQLLEQEDPVDAYRKIEDIFIKNNLPLVGKLYRVFAILNNPKEMANVLEGNKALSPCLREYSERKRYFTIYKDILNIHIKSGNRSLRDYLEIFQEGQLIFDKLESEGESALSETELKQAESLFKKIRTLRSNSALGSRFRSGESELNEGIGNAYDNLKESIGARDDQTVSDRISRMFLAPAGYGSIEDVLLEMKSVNKAADERSRRTAELLAGGNFNINNGDFIKGIPSDRLEYILQGGAVAREFLGSESGSDSTPYDSDVLRVSKASSGNDFATNLKSYYSEVYGDINVIMRDRGQFCETTEGNAKNYDGSKYEFFRSGFVSNEHYGIRTGLPSSEIDLMVVNQEAVNNERKNEKIFFEIAKNGFYIPVSDTLGNLLYTPEMYDEYRKFFAGIDRYDGGPLEFVTTEDGDKNFQEVSNLTNELPKDRESVREMNVKIRNAIEGVLRKNDISLKDEWDSGIIGAELDNTGSTGRHTNAPSDYDFDLVLRLDDADMSKVGNIIEELKTVLGSEDNGSHNDDNEGYQFRIKNVSGIGEKPADIDIGFVRKSELVQYGSHDAVEEKLEWIKGNIGENAYDQAIANIVLTKKILKEGNAYKKLESGGIGGIGVENWILSNGGNMIKAFESFYEASHDADGNAVSLDEFRKKYKIIDPGMNLKFNSHDNFIIILKENGYQSMLGVIENYLGINK